MRLSQFNSGNKCLRNATLLLQDTSLVLTAKEFNLQGLMKTSTQTTKEEGLISAIEK